MTTIQLDSASAWVVFIVGVAAVIAQALVEPATIRRTVLFNDGEQPIAEALQA